MLRFLAITPAGPGAWRGSVEGTAIVGGIFGCQECYTGCGRASVDSRWSMAPCSPRVAIRVTPPSIVGAASTGSVGGSTISLVIKGGSTVRGAGASLLSSTTVRGE